MAGLFQKASGCWRRISSTCRVSIGLETNFRELKQYLVGGKPLILYACGQALNLALTLAMAWLMFTKFYPNAAAALGK